MLPDTLASAYRCYKSDIDYIASWLAVTAKVHGCVFEGEEPERTGRLKGKAKKAAKGRASDQTPPAKQHTIKIKDFVPLARFLVDRMKSPITIPTPVIASLSHVIRVRRDFGGMLEELNCHLDRQSV
ncbi:hypothetical protein JX265_012724 [Neoarthrinium moseri]|uniref:DUF6604 domain-containing protein n=1 Tax=Neoarthrinium moseri TaxID=1658444 RepID=A0A9P9WA09_9PEZI|nr:hypothetical protein JX265_012724 [Neoarthrinium moseri]